MTTRHFGPFLWCAMGLLVGWAGSAAAQEKLVLGYSNLQSSKIPVPIAKDAGLFAKYGLDVEMIRVTPGNTAVPKLLSGEIQIFLGNGDPIAKAALMDRAPLVVIASLGEDSFQLIGRSSIHSVADLKGKRVGISTPGSSADRFARATLKALKLDPDRDVRLVTTGLDESKARLGLVVKGDIDATIADIENMKALGERSTTVTSVADLGQLGIFVSGADVSTTRAFIRTKRDTLKRFLSAVVEAIALAKSQPAVARAAYAKYGNVTDPRVLEWRSTEFLRTRVPDMPYPNRPVMASYVADADPTGKATVDAVADFSLMQEVAEAARSGAARP